MDENPRLDTSLIEQFKTVIVEASSDPNFLHHPWYVKYHLEIVEKLAWELLEFYPQADPDMVDILVWLHDYGKTIDVSRDRELTVIEGRRRLLEIGFGREFVERVVGYAEMIDSDRELDLSSAPIEVQIVSSADACSHFTGPFFQLWWWENADKPFKDLMEDNRQKIMRDWSRKIVLPEARAAFEARHSFLLEQTGDLPQRFIGRAS